MSINQHLFIDVGNTRIKWALVDSDVVTTGNGVAFNVHEIPWRHTGVLIQEQLAQLQEIWQPYIFSHVWISNVSGQIIHEHIERILQQRAPSPLITWIEAQAELAGIRNAYRTPQKLGCDRFASAIAARHLFPEQPLLIVTCGTATTLDVINTENVFLGGLIMPGLPLMMRALANHTAHLRPEMANDAMFSLYANNTQEAITSGCLVAHIGAIEHVWHGLIKENPKFLCILSGGGADFIVPHLPIPFHKVDNLVLSGLFVIAMNAFTPL